MVRCQAQAGQIKTKDGLEYQDHEASTASSF